MKEEIIFNKLIKMLRDHGLLREDVGINRETSFKKDLFFDDLDIVMLLEEVEKELNIRLPENPTVENFGNLIDLCLST